MSPTGSNAIRPDSGRVLVAGAGGFLGEGIVRAFSQRGWEVRGLVRDMGKADRVRAAGGSPVLGDVLDLDSLRKATAECDAVVHVAANPSDERASADLAREVRVEGTLNLARAAWSSHVRRMVVGSGYWVYASDSGTITEDSRLDPQGESKNNFDAERAGLGANVPGKFDVIVVRPGMVYGAGAWFQPTLEAVRAGTYTVIDGGTNHWSFVSLPDCGAGFFSAVTSGRAGEVYNIVDRHPAPWGEFARFLARRVGRPPPESVSLEAAEKAFGPVVAKHLAANRSASSAKLEGIGWRPTNPRFQEGVELLLR